MKKIARSWIVMLGLSVAQALMAFAGEGKPVYPRQISLNITMIGEGSFPCWSGVTGLITFTKKVDDQYEVFTMKPDGSEIKCLTGGKASLRDCGNRGQSYWHPSGKYIVFHAENKNLKRIGFGASARPGWGRNFNV